MTEHWTVEEIVAHNSHELTAHLLLSERERTASLLDAHRQEMSATLAKMGKAQRIGIEVFRAQRAGRKTVRVADLVAAAEVPS